ncbi:MAG: N-6 DNA methylase [Bacilli bacterium]
MANERKTENIVREHFNQYSDLINIEEQKSDNPKVNKLLKYASKKGPGQGYPEFIISFKDNSDLLIVVECKSDIRNHESENRDRYSDYAVDGALLYASFLAKEFDVIAIAISGESIRKTKISHFLHLKGENVATSIFGNKLLSAKDYLTGYLHSPEKFRQDYSTLIDFTKELNDDLHTHKILESQRSLLISSIIIALENQAFLNSYAVQNTPKSLADSLIHTVSSELHSANITGDKLENLKTQFSFIQTDTSLSQKKDVLKNIIKAIHTNIKSFMKNHKYYDVLGQLYIEFLRYANSDKGLGIVLTPPHITEFFSELAQVNKDSIIYDNCTGTGGFLIGAMKKMIQDAKGDSDKIRRIKSQQLIGTEYQSHIFALAVSNMYIHQDGKTNIYNGDCFDEQIIESVKGLRPTVGFLNPPYKSKKSDDLDELEFILNNLDCLVEGGTCVAIVPMQSALAIKGKVYELKKKILEKHTLDAVLSMPNELFFNSNVNVVTCIMVFTAKKPHPSHKSSYFGYYKDDGFQKRKTKGRIDVFGKWNDIKERWLRDYINKVSVPGLSVNKSVTASMEWVAEAYMETDYSFLTIDHFSRTLLNYVTYLLGNELTENIYKAPFSNEIAELDTKKWKEFKLKDIFDIKGSTTTSIIELEEYGIGDYPYVTTKATNNGVDGFFNYYTEEGNVLTIDSAVLGYSSYQSLPFSASDHVEKLIPKFSMNKFIGLFLVTVINLEQYRFNYGRKCSQTRLKKLSIKLPTKNQKPDFDYMERFIKSIPFSSSI